MFKTKICPKCGGTDIYHIPGVNTYNTDESGRFITVSGFFSVTTLPLAHCVCIACGYTEEYVCQEGLKKIQEAAMRGKLEKL